MRTTIATKLDEALVLAQLQAIRDLAGHLCAAAADVARESTADNVADVEALREDVSVMLRDLARTVDGSFGAAVDMQRKRVKRAASEDADA